MINSKTDSLYRHITKLHGNPNEFDFDVNINWDDAPFTSYINKSNVQIMLPKVSIILSKVNDSIEITAFEKLSLMLWGVYGCTGSRLFYASTESNKLPKVHLQRAIAAGGARYPADILIRFSRGWNKLWCNITNYIYAYCPTRHVIIAHCQAIECEHDASLTVAPDAINLIVLTRFTRTSYKYKDFAYRLANVDVGLLLGRLHEFICNYNLNADINFLGQNKIDDIETITKSSIPTVGFSISVTKLGRQEITTIGSVPEYKTSNENQKSEAERQALSILLSEDKVKRYAIHCRENNINPIAMLKSIRQRTSSAKLYTGNSLASSVLMRCLRAASEIKHIFDLTETDEAIPDITIYCCVLNCDNIEPGYYKYESVADTLIQVNTGINRELLVDSLYIKSANISLSSFVIHLAGELDWYNKKQLIKYYNLQQYLIGAMIDKICLAASGQNSSAHPYLGFDRKKLKALYSNMPDNLDFLAKICVGYTRTSNWLFAPLIGMTSIDNGDN